MNIIRAISTLFPYALLSLLALSLCACGVAVPVREVHVPNTQYIDTPYQGQVSQETAAEIQQRYPAEDIRREGNSGILTTCQRLQVTVREFEIHPQDPDMGRTIADVFTTIFVRDPSFEVVERERLNQVVQEIELQQSGLVDTSSIADPTDTMVGAVAFIINGSASQIGNTWRVDARVMDATKGKLLFAETANAPTLDARTAEMLARRIAGRLKATPRPNAQSTPPGNSWPVSSPPGPPPLQPQYP